MLFLYLEKGYFYFYSSSFYETHKFKLFTGYLWDYKYGVYLQIRLEEDSSNLLMKSFMCTFSFSCIIYLGGVWYRRIQINPDIQILGNMMPYNLDA